jgi:hypothetical protein
MTRKITIKGEVFAFEERYSMAEAIALEEGLGMTFGEWINGLLSGSVKSMAGQVWLILSRAGKDVPLADILSGEYDLDLADITAEVVSPDPTEPAPSSPLTGDGTSESSPRSSDTTPTTSTGSPPATSTT